MNNSVEVEAKKIYSHKLFAKIVKIVFLLLLIVISIIYISLYVIYDGGRFTVSLDKNFTNQKNIYLSEKKSFEKKYRKLTAETIDYMDNISVKWLPDNIDTVKDGAHNGENYIAYTFYVINDGNEDVHYWYEIDIDDTVKNVDEAIRVMVYLNGKPTIYAKKNRATKKAEPNTKMFTSESIAVLEQRKNFKSKGIDKFTIVVWIEGDDPECKNNLLGGEIKMHMDITEEHFEENRRKKV